MAKGSSDYKKVINVWFFKEPLTECFFVEPKLVLLWQKNLLSTFIFKSEGGPDAFFYTEQKQHSNRL